MFKTCTKLVLHLAGGEKKSTQGGFTLPEMLIAITIASMMMMTLSQSLAPALNFYGKQETEVRLKDLRAAFLAAYKSEYALIDGRTDAVFQTSRGVVSPLMPDSGLCPSNEFTFAPVGAYLSSSASVAWRDGHGQGVCVFITERRNGSIQGVQFAYRSLAVVSLGADGGLDPATGLSSDGVLTLGGDDKGFLVDGKQIAEEKVRLTFERMDRVSDVLAVYFLARFRSNPARDISVYYFARTNQSGDSSPRYDEAGSIPNSSLEQGGRIELSNAAHAPLVASLGLSLTEVQDAWGGSLFLDNSGASVRNPESATPAMRLPPYTARISARLPNNSLVEKTVVGYY